jgi:hypothetical protein
MNNMNTTRWDRLARLAVLLVAPFGMTACGAGGPAKAPAEGTVTYNGTPLAQGTVQFWPEAGVTEANPAVMAVIADGKFALGLGYEEAGVLPGTYKVSVSSYEEAQVNNRKAMPKSLIPERYGDRETSGLVVAVPEDGDRALKIELAGALTRPSRPARASNRIVLSRTR